MIENTGGGGFGIDSGRDEWPNWETLVQGFQFDNLDVFQQ